MAIYLVAIKAYMFIMFINWGMLAVATLAGSDPISPIDASTYINSTNTSVPNFLNQTDPTGSAYKNFTDVPFNSSSDPFDATNFGILDYFNWTLMGAQWIISAISPYYILSFLLVLGYDPIFILGMSGAIGISFILMFIYYITGKGV